MSNIFNSMAKYFGPKEHTVNTEVYQPNRAETGKGLIVLGYSVVYFDTRSKSRVNNFDNL
jgi:hypothetical protein